MQAPARSSRSPTRPISLNSLMFSWFFAALPPRVAEVAKYFTKEELAAIRADVAAHARPGRQCCACMRPVHPMPQGVQACAQCIPCRREPSSAA